MSAANVDDPRERPEVISFGDGLVAALAQRDHGALKQSSLLGVFRQPAKPWAPEHLVEGRLSSANRMQELFERKIGLAVYHPDKVTRTRLIRSEHGPDVGQPELTRRYFIEHALRRQKSHHAVKCVSIRLRGCCQVIH